MSRALDGIRVIDFGQYIAGPLAAMILGDQGAEVIRIDPIGGPMWKTPANAVWNRGKKSITLNLKESADRRIAQQLVESADVVIENFRPGVMERLELGPEAMTKRNPGLVYCSIPGFSADDTRASIPGFDGLIGAATGLFRPSPLPSHDNDRPVYTAVPIPSNFASFQAAVSIVMALIARERDGLGQTVEISLFDAVFDAISDARWNPPGTFPQPSGKRAPTIWDIAFLQAAGTCHRCKDGRWIDFWPVNPRFMEWFADAADIGHWRGAGLLDWRRLKDSPDLQGELNRRMKELFLTRTALEWERLGTATRIPLKMHRSSAEWLAHDQAHQSRAVIEVTDPEYGPMWQPGFPVTLSATPGSTSPRHALDVDRQPILDDLLLHTRNVSTRAPRASVAPALDGIRALDVSQVVAGPTAGRILADFGAEVIKINNPLDPTPPDHLLLNRGKRHVLLNLKSPDGVAVLNELIDRSDVFIQNFARGQAEKLGFGYEQASLRRPRLIYCSISAYSYEGPWGDGRGYEPVAQAPTGIQTGFGGLERPLNHPLHRITDFGTGIFGALAIGLGLFHRLRTGQGQHVQGSLVHSGTFHQTPYLYSYAGKVWNEPKGQYAVGEAPLYRLYRAKDKWFFLAAKPEWLATANSIDGLAGIGSLVGNELEQMLEERFRTTAADVWIERLRVSGAGAHSIQTIEEMLEDPRAHARALSVWQEYHGVMVRTVGPPPRLSRTPVQPIRLPKPYGGDTRMVLTEIGLASRIDDLMARKVVASEPIADAEGEIRFN